MNARTVLFVLLALLLSIAVVAAVVWPLLRRPRARAVAREEVNVQVLRDQLAELDADLRAGTLSQAQYDEARGDISRRLIENLDGAWPREDAGVAPLPRGNRRLAISLAILVPVLALVAYVLIGAPMALEFDDLTTARAPGDEPPGGAQGAGAITPEKVMAMIEVLKQKQAANPADAQVAAMLARAYNFVRRYPEAVAAYRVALPLNPNDAELLADYADALAMAQNKTLGPEVMKLIHDALAIDPDNLKALALSGTEAFQRKDYAAAVATWKRAYARAQGRDEQLAEQFRANILEANQLGGGKLIAESELGPAPGGTPTTAMAPNGPAAPAGRMDAGATAAGAVSGRITLSATLRDRVSPADAVFIYAKAASGPPMPLAVVRARVQDLPLDFRLDDSLAMMPGLTLSRFPVVVVGARVSKSGNAVPAAGDLQGQLKDVKPGASGLQIEISEVVP